MASFNPFSGSDNDVLTDEFMGDTYPVVKSVASNIEYIKHVSANLEAIYSVSLIAEGLGIITTNIDAILALSASAPDYTTIVDNIDGLQSIWTVLDDILATPDEAQAWATLAQDWAEKPANVPVQPGDYSSFHWAQEAAADALTVQSNADHVDTVKSQIDASLVLITAASWVMQYGLEISGSNTYLKIVDYIGGIGTKPTAYIGYYLKGDGTLSATSVGAANLRGPVGAGSGDMLAAQNLNDLASKSSGFDNIKQAASDTYTGVVELLTLAEIRAGTDTTRVPTIDAMYDALAEVVITDQVTIAWDMSLGINFKLTLGASRFITNPTNQLLNKSGRLKLIQNATGGWQPTWGTNFVFDSDVAPLIDTTANSINIFYYDVIDASTVFISLAARKVS